mgnify:CR=1 FL=1
MPENRRIILTYMACGDPHSLTKNGDYKARKETLIQLIDGDWKHNTRLFDERYRVAPCGFSKIDMSGFK